MELAVFHNLLAGVSYPTEVLNTTAYFIAFHAKAKGVFISTQTVEYMDVAIGTMQEKRTIKNKKGISVADIYKIFGESGNIGLGSGGYIHENVYVYKTRCDWIVGIDGLSSVPAFLKKDLDDITSAAYPVFKQLLKMERNSPYRDDITYTYNRKKFYEDMRVVLKMLKVRERIPVWMFYLSVLNIPIISEKFSHALGDEVLRNTIYMVKSVFSSVGTIYRITNTVFVGIAVGINQQDTETLARRIEDITFQAPTGIPVRVNVNVEEINGNYKKYSDANLDNAIDGIITKIEKRICTDGDPKILLGI